MAEATLQVQIKALVEGLDQLKQLGATIADNTKDFTDLGDAGTALKGVLGTIAESVKGYLGDLKAGSQSQAEFAEGIDGLAKSLEEVSKGFEDSSEQGQFLKGFIDSISSGLHDYADQVRKSGEDNSHFKDTVKELGTEFGEAKDKAIELAKKIGEITGLAALVGSALSAISIEKFFEEGVKGATDFEDAMARLAATSGRSRESLQDVAEAASEIGAGLGFQSGETVDALTALTQGIGDVDEATKALTPTLELARVTNLGLAESAQFVTTQLTQYGLAAEDASTVTDTLVTASQVAGISMGELVRQFQLVGPFAAAAGLSIKDTATILAGVAESGLRGRIAYSALIEVFSQLGDASSDFRTRLRALGIDSDNLGTVFQQLATKGTKAEIALEGFSDRTRSAIRKLLADGGANLDIIAGKLGNVAGATDRAAKEIEATLSQTASRAKKALDNLAEALILPSLPTLTDGFSRLEKALNDFGKSDAFKTLQKAFTDLVTDGVDFLANSLSSIDFDGLSKEIAGFVDDTSDNLGKIATAAKTTGQAIAFVANSIALIFNTLKTVVASALEVVAAAAVAILQVAQVAALSRGNLVEAQRLGNQLELLKRTVSDLDGVAEEAALKVGKNLQAIGGNVSALGDDGAKAADGVNKLNKATGDSDFMAKYGKDAKFAADSLDDLDTANTSVLGSLSTVKGEFDELKPSFDNVVSGVNDAGKAIAGIGTAFDDTDTSSTALETRMAAVASEMADLQAAGLGTSQRFRDLEVEYGNLSNKLAAGGFDSARAQVISLNEKIDEEIKKFRALQIAGKDTAEATADFEQKMRDLNGQLDRLNTGRAGEAIDALGDKFKQLGIQSRAQLETLRTEAEQAFADIAASATQSAEDQNQVRAAFEVVVKRTLDSLKFETEATKASAEAKLIERAATLGDTDAVNALIDAYNKLGSVGKGGGGGSPLADTKQSIDDVSSSLDLLGSSAKGATAQVASDFNEQARDAADFANRVSGALGDALAIEQGYLQEFSAISKTAVDRFSKAMVEFFNGAQIFSTSAIADGTGIIKFAEATIKAGQLIEAQVQEQRVGVADLTAQYDLLAQSADAATFKSSRNLDALAAGLAGTAAAARQGVSAFDLLGAADLSGLASALDGIAQRVRQIKEQALEATASLKDMLSSTQDQIDEILGNQKAIENRRHEEALKQIDELKSTGADQATVDKATKAENVLHELKLRNIKEQQQEQQAAADKQHQQDIENVRQQQQAQQEANAREQDDLNLQLKTTDQITATVKKTLPFIPGQTGVGGGFLGGVVGGGGTQVPFAPGGGAPGLSGAVNPVQVIVNIENALGTQDQLADTITRRVALNLQKLGVLSR